MFQTIRVIGRGRVGSAVAARLIERGHLLDDAGELVLLCVPDSAIGQVAQSIAPGPWIAHTSGATPLATLSPHTRRFSVHPLQTIVKGRGPEQLDGVRLVAAEVHRRQPLGGEEVLPEVPVVDVDAGEPADRQLRWA